MTSKSAHQNLSSEALLQKLHFRSTTSEAHFRSTTSETSEALLQKHSSVIDYHSDGGTEGCS